MNETHNDTIQLASNDSVREKKTTQGGNSPDLKKKTIKKKPVKFVINSMETFLAAALKSRRGSINEGNVRFLKEKPSIDSEVRTRFLEDAALIDTDLELGRQLMFSALQTNSSPRVSEILRGIARDLFLQHPRRPSVEPDASSPTSWQAEPLRTDSPG